MNRKQFIQSKGAECENWLWSWSFVNHREKFVIFGIWSTLETGDLGLILGEWGVSDRGRRQPGYSQAIEHIRLIEKQNYKLFTFPIYPDDVAKQPSPGRAVIKKFDPILTERTLCQIGNSWYAGNVNAGFFHSADELKNTDLYMEGGSYQITVNAYERNPMARLACLEHFGYDCQVCRFNFEDEFGDIGKNYIHVHHIRQLSDIKMEYKVDPVKDLIPVCANCHAMIHRVTPALTIDEARKLRLTLQDSADI